MKKRLKNFLMRFPELYFYVDLLYRRWTAFQLNRMTEEEFLAEDIEKEIGRKLDLENPRSFTEKLNWIRIHGDIEPYYIYADKLLVRKYIAEKVGEQYLVPLLGVWDNADDIDFDKLPDRFVLKATHGCGYNVLCTDKSSLPIKLSRKQLNSWLRENYGEMKRERQYRHCQPRIFCEEYLDEPGGLYDYKFYCFHGVPMYCQCIGERNLNAFKCDFYDMDWNLMPFTFPILVHHSHPHLDKPKEKPAAHATMLEIARKLSAGFAFIRIDLYCVADKVYCGEITIIPANGQGLIVPDEWNLKVGALLDLSKYPTVQPRPGIRV